MNLHDPDTEKNLIRIAKRVVGSAGFDRGDNTFWRTLLKGFILYVVVGFLLAVVLIPAWDKETPVVLRQALCALLLMFLVRHGLGQVAMAFRTTGFFSTLANLPIAGPTALLHVRGLVFRRFWLFALLGPLIAATLLHTPLSKEKSAEILVTWILLSAIICSTLGIIQIPWVHRLRIAKLWHLVAYCLIGYFILLYFLGNGLSIPSQGRETVATLINHLLWAFPPSWVFPGKIENGGLFPAIIWIAWGCWSWKRWPSTVFPEYDRPLDFIGAFGHVGITRHNTDEADDGRYTSLDEGEIIFHDSPPARLSTSWIDRLIVASLPVENHLVAGAMMPASGNPSAAVNLSMIIAPIWLLAVGFGKKFIPDGGYGDYIHILVWAAPTIFFFLVLLPIKNPIKDAIRPCPVGNDHVPFFITIPVSLRALLQITFRITIVRTCIAILIATPFFWILAKLYPLLDVASGLLVAIPAVGAAWILSTPSVISNRLEPHTRRKRGILILSLAISLAMVPIGLLWIVGSIAGIALAVAWATGTIVGAYAFLLLPAAILCLLLGGVMSRLLFEVFHLSLRQRNYDWKSKIN